MITLLSLNLLLFAVGLLTWLHEYRKWRLLVRGERAQRDGRGRACIVGRIDVSVWPPQVRHVGIYGARANQITVIGSEHSFDILTVTADSFHEASKQAQQVLHEGVEVRPWVTELYLHPWPAKPLCFVPTSNVDGERLTCLICGHGHEEFRDPPEWIVTMQSQTQTLGKGLHEACWERHRSSRFGGKPPLRRTSDTNE